MQINNKIPSPIVYSKPVRIYRANEQGVALIVVLLFLILIMLAGVMAVRQSNTDLKTATADQINTALLQSSDSANEKLEAMVNGSPSSQDYQSVMGIAGMFGYFILNPNSTGSEYMYCFNPASRKYTIVDATVRQNNAYLYGTDNRGICDYNSSNGYSTSRGTVMTQVYLTTTQAASSVSPFSQMTLGKESENRTSKSFQFDIYSTSALPSYNAPTGCLTTFSTDSASATTPDPTRALNCLHNANTPSKMLYEQANLENTSDSTKCIPFGKGSLSADSLCSVS